MHLPRLSRRTQAAVAALAAAAALLAACGGGDATADATAVAAPETTASPAPSAPAPQTATATPRPPSAVLARADGLTGAPVPAPVAASSAFDAGRADARAGSFPPLDDPQVAPAGEAPWMADDDLVLGAVRNGEARAYPLFMMTFHHVANDQLGGEPYLVTF